jgi:hypothetical protein
MSLVPQEAQLLAGGRGDEGHFNDSREIYGLSGGAGGRWGSIPA